MKLLRQIAIQFGVTFVALALLFTLGAPALQHFEGHPAIQKAIYTLGFAGEAYAITPDYEVDGNADDVQVQQALNALPVTGGKLILYAGNWHFNATVSRAINNVTIEGDGKGTYLANNAATALFSAGVQTGWVFKDFRTDAGWVTVSSAGDTRFLGALWKGTELVSNVVASGTTMPATPIVGQEFRQVTTGRDVLYSYNGSAWVPMESFGTMTVYVDKTDGTNDFNHGTGVDALAFASIQYAWDFIPPLIGGGVTINVNNETYNESLVFDGVAFTSSVVLQGTLTEVASGTVDSAVQGTGATQGCVRDVGVFGAYDNMLLYANSEYRVIDSDTADNATIVGTWTGVPAGAYKVYNWGTKITGTTSLTVQGQQNNISVRDIEFDGSSSDIHLYTGAVDITRVKTAGGVVVEVDSTFFANTSLFNGVDAGTSIVAKSYGEFWLDKWNYTGAVPRWLLVVQDASSIYLDGGNVFDGHSVANTTGLYCAGTSTARFDPLWYPTHGYARMRNLATGVYARDAANALGTASTQYSGNTFNESFDAPSYGLVD